MIDQRIYYLKTLSNARFHFGEVSNDSGLSSTSAYPHSDTLWGAILHNAFLLNEDKANVLLEEMESGKVAISSAFFFIENENSEKLTFLPKPVIYDTYLIENPKIDPKKIKQVEMISKGVWESGLSPESWFDSNHCGSLQNGKFIYLKQEGEFDENLSVYKKEVTPKVPLSYLGNEETEEDKRSIYYQSDVFLIPNDGFSTGYYFLLKNNLDEELFEFLNESIQLITNFGIGGDRSTGAGQITQIENDSFEWGFDSDVFSNLSLLIPSDDEVYRNGYYKTKTRGGQALGGDERLDYIHCLDEGGVFKNKLKGKVVSIGQEKVKVGISYFAPFNSQNINL